MLGIKEEADKIEFVMDLVLREQLPSTTRLFPMSSIATRERQSVRSCIDGGIDSQSMETARAVDANGDVDYGNIDTLEVTDGAYHLTVPGATDPRRSTDDSVREADKMTDDRQPTTAANRRS